MQEFNRIIRQPELKLEGEINGFGPVQGEGTINNHPFYFRARHNEWSFAISEHQEMDPVDIQFIETGKKYGFYKEMKYCDKRQELASYISLVEAEKIIIDCCKEYLKIKNVC